MTVLEVRRRRQKRLQLLKRPYLKRKWSRFGLKTGLKTSARSSRKPSNSRSSAENAYYNEPMEAPTLDDMTVMAMKSEVEELLLQANGSVTVLAMVNAIVASPHVLKTYAEDGTRNGVGLIERMLNGLKLGEASRSNKRQVQRRYELMRALQELEARPSSSASHVTTWEDAQEELRTVVSFPPAKPVDGSEEVNESQESGSSLKAYQERFDAIRGERLQNDLKNSHRMLQQVATAATLPSVGADGVGLDAADAALAKELSGEYEKRAARLKDPAVEEMEARLVQQERDEEAKKRAESLMQQLSEEDKERVFEALHNNGSPTEVVAQVGPDSIQRESIQRLLPGEWLNDEVIHYFVVMLAKRDEEMCRLDPSRKRSHFFKSFFMTKLLNEGNANPDLDGQYEYKNVKRWSKKVPGKDIFNLDKIVFPINQGQMHWVCAVIHMKKKRIQFYDSMGGSGRIYLESLFQYLKDEHQDKKKCPLPDIDEWELVPCTVDTPRQLNGFDCGVFTCMFADFLSKDCPLVFGQSHITQCRERIVLSILNGQAVM